MKLDKGLVKGIAKISSIVFLLTVLGFFVFNYVLPAFADATSIITIRTDKQDYSPEETVLISGNGFNAASDSNPVQIKITRPDSTVHVCPDSYWCPMALPTTSSFSDYQYKLDGIEGNYIIDATDGNNTATTTFTDAFHITGVASSDSGGTAKTSFLTTENVYAKITYTGTGSKGVRVYIVTSIPADKGTLTDVRGTYSSATFTDSAPTQLAWSASTTTGTYYIVLDENTDGKYDTPGDSASSAFTVVQCLTGDCCYNYQFRSASYVCRAAGTCDLEEKCTGSSATCPTDLKAPFGTDCNDNLWCSEIDQCDGSGNCIQKTARDCSSSNIAGIATCDNIPDDNYHPTWDTRNPFTSTCDEQADACTDGSSIDVTNTCDVTQCGAECDETHSCANKCVDGVRYFGGSCTSGCTCSYSSENCNSQDGWYDTGSKQWVSTGECTQKEQKEQKYRDYSCDPSGCTYSETNTQWVDTGNTGNKDDGTTCGSAPSGDCDSQDTCVQGQCVDNIKPNTEICKPSQGQCDVAEYCDGTNKNCPADLKSTAVCRSSAGDCDIAESCNGVSNDCPTDMFKPSTFECRAADGLCDVAETCTGTTATCPADAKSTAQCRAADGACDVSESCNGVDNACPADAVRENGYVCAAESAQCDADDTCDGATKNCNEVYASSGTSCDDGLFCNVNEVCDGSGSCGGGTAKDCSSYNILGIDTCLNNPDNIAFTLDFRNPFTSACDENADICSTGSETIIHTCNKATCGAQCEVNADCDDGNVHTTDTCNLGTCGCEHEYVPYCGDSTVDPGEVCDDGASNGQPNHCNAECTGTTTPVCGNSVIESGEQCESPFDSCCDSSTCQFKPAQTECRAADGDCDVAEVCSGSSATCPSDGVKSSSEVCRGSQGVCDVVDYCDGTTKACPADAKSIAVCRAADGICDVSESCDGVNDVCPGDAVKPDTFVCKDSAGFCDLAERCDGSAKVCPTDVFKTAQTECRASAGDCDLAEMCTGSGALCPDDGFKPSTEVCRDSAGQCDVAESCTGTGALCPDNAFVSAGTSCNDGLFCNVNEVCDGSGSCGAGTAMDCSYNNIAGINTCTYVPDSNPFTLDSRNAFTSTCDETNNLCPTGSDTITHTCDKTNCGAQCKLGDSQSCTTGDGYSGTQDCSASCTWNACTPTEVGAIIIIKNTVGGDDTFGFTITGPTPSSPSISTTGGTETTGPIIVNAGTYSVSESALAGWDLTGSSCTSGTPSSFVVPNGGSVTCTFINTKRGHIVVDKVTNPSGDPQSFTFTATGTGYSGFSLTDAAAPNDQELVPGTYSVSENAQSGWDLTSATCDNQQSPNNIQLAAGQTVTCTFTNTKRGTIIVEKQTLPDGSTQTFGFTGTAAGSISDGQTIEAQVAPGTYTSTETVPVGWDLTNIQCDAGGSGDLNTKTATFNLQAGQTIKCIFTNTKRGTIIVEKQTNPDGAPGSFTFTGTVAGIISDNGQIVVSDLVPGTYTSTESDPTPSFDLTSIVCDDGSSQTPSSSDVATRIATFKVDPGETVKCVFTNIKLGEVRGIKFKDITGNGQKDFGETGLSGWTIYADLNNNEKLDFGEPSTGTGFDGSYILRGLSPGIYTVREVVKKGWIQTMPVDGKYTVTVSIGSVVSGKDFGNFELGSISGIKFRDTNGNGIKDSGEIKLPGWTIYLDMNDNGIHDSEEPFIVTDRSGRYEFTGLLAGTYHVREVLQDGWLQTTPAGGKHTVTIVSGSEISGKDFGNRLGEIRGIKFEDVNGNGVKDAGEKVLQGWTIYLDLNNNGKLDSKEPSKITDKNGEFWFSDLAPGTYTVREVVKNGWVQTSPVGGKYIVTITIGDVITGKDFGNAKVGSISGIKFLDTNGNGVRDDAEKKLSGWKIYLDLDNNGNLGPGEPFTVTGSNGKYEFASLTPGTYNVREVLQSGWLQTTPAGGKYTVTILSGSKIIGNDFGNKLGEIHGLKFEDVNGNGVRDLGEKVLQGWTIYLDLNNNEKLDSKEPSGITDRNGEYLFSDLAPGTYTVREVVKNGWVQTMPVDGKYIVEITNGNVVTGKDFGNAKVGSISGLKFKDANGNGVKDAGEPGLSGRTIFLDTNNNGVLDAGELSTTTKMNGGYEFTGLAAGTYNVREVVQSGWTQITPAGGKYAVTITSGLDVKGKDFGNKLGEIHGMKFEDINGNGINDENKPLSGWTIYLDINNNGRRDGGEPSEATDRNGEYEFLDLTAGTYTVREVVKSGWTQTAPADGKYVVTITNGDVVTGKDFGNFKPGSISGIKFKDTNGNGVRNTGEAKLAGWTIYLDKNDNGALDPGEQSTVTDATGKYQFTNLGPGTYNVREVLPAGWTQTFPLAPGKHTVVLISGLDVTGKDFGNKPV